MKTLRTSGIGIVVKRIINPVLKVGFIGVATPKHNQLGPEGPSWDVKPQSYAKTPPCNPASDTPGLGERMG